jgi:adenylate kinase
VGTSKEEDKMKLVLLGPPGAGKGTQAKELARELKLPHISTGDLLRKNVAQGTALGKAASDFMNKGALVPDELVNQMLTDRLKEPDAKKGFILDGYPRNIQQAEALDSILKGMNRGIDVVVYLDTSDAVIIQRLSGRLVCKKCGANFHGKNMPPKIKNICDNCGGELYQRTDDKEETVKKRIEVYKKEVASLISYYEARQKLHRINADIDAGIVFNKIVELAQNDSLKV